MQSTTFAWAFSLVTAVVATVQATDSVPMTIDVAPVGNARLWQGYQPADGKVKWTWGAADAATLVVYEGISRTTVSTDLTASGTTGEWTIPACSETEDAVYDLTLTLKRGGEVLETRTARVASPAAKWTLLGDTADRSWTRVKDGPKLFVYDRSWSTDASATTASYKLAYGGETQTVDLPEASGGYGVLDASAVDTRTFVASLYFGSTLCAEAGLIKALGLTFIVR